MTRKFTEHSYQYIQGWLKNKYATDPAFKKKYLENTSFYYIRNKMKYLVNKMTVELLIETYASRIS